MSHSLIRMLRIGLLLLVPLVSRAAPPLVISYQGQLTSPSSVPLGGTAAIIVKIYPTLTGGGCQSGSGDCPLYGETQTAVPLQNGTFNLLIGTGTGTSGSLTNVAGAATAFLELTVNGETLTPREQLVSAPFSVKTTNATTLSLHTLQQVINNARGLQGPPGDPGVQGDPGAAGSQGPSNSVYAYCDDPIAYTSGCFPAPGCNCGPGRLLSNSTQGNECTLMDSTGAPLCSAHACFPSQGVGVAGDCCICERF
jgi:hypothetical protein